VSRRRAARALVISALALAVLAGCGRSGRSGPPSGASKAAPTSAPTSGATVAVADGPVISGFLAFGDFGGGGAQASIAAAMTSWAATHRVDALVTVGDNVYPSGQPSLFSTQLDQPYAELRKTRPLWVTLGNHDILSGHGGADQLRHLRLPPLPFTQALPGVQLLFVDANRPDAAQADWLEKRLSEPGPRFRVVSFHQPAWSCGIHGSTERVDAAWVPVFERHRVALVLNGHDHDYERFVSSAGVTYVVTGGGGQTLYPLFTGGCATGAREIASAAIHRFTAVEVRERSLTITAVAADGRVIDRAVIER
jgi:tartrate-resistant acid phosphatase type 5